MRLSFGEGGKESDSKQVRFGVREVTYELGLLDGKGQMRRVDYSPTAARARGEQVVDVSHEGMRQIPAADPIPPDFAKRMARLLEFVGFLAHACRRNITRGAAG